MKIGIFGGTFNPVHFGHLRTIEDVRENFNLDIVYFVLSKIPPHKSDKNIISAALRYKLLKLAIGGNPMFTASSVELRRKKTSYSIDTVKYFLRKFKTDQLFFILGSDAFAEIDTWFNYVEILNSVDIIVMQRESYNYDESFLEKLGYSKKGDCRINKENKKLFFNAVTRLDISSSKIRENLKNGNSVRYLLPHNCLKYIIKKNLYK